MKILAHAKDGRVVKAARRVLAQADGAGRVYTVPAKQQRADTRRYLSDEQFAAFMQRLDDLYAK